MCPVLKEDNLISFDEKKTGVSPFWIHTTLMSIRCLRVMVWWVWWSHASRSLITKIKMFQRLITNEMDFKQRIIHMSRNEPASVNVAFVVDPWADAYQGRSRNFVAMLDFDYHSLFAANDVSNELMVVVNHRLHLMALDRSLKLKSKRLLLTLICSSTFERNLKLLLTRFIWRMHMRWRWCWIISLWILRLIRHRSTILILIWYICWTINYGKKNKLR